MHTHDAHGLPYFISSSGVMQSREACYTVVSYAPYILLQIYTITILITFWVTIFDFFQPGPKPNMETPHRQGAAQWLSGRVLDSRLKGRGFEPHRRHCVVVLEQDTFILA